MYKVIDLGSTVPSTGELRVRILDTDLTKTASSAIQGFWDTINSDPKYMYLWVIGVSAQEYYGCNNNGDSFTEADLRRTHKDFVENAHVFMHHVNKDPAKSIGKPVFSTYNEDMHRIELILRVDKSAPGAESIVEKAEKGEQLYVSMGCTVKYDECSICGNKAPTRREYCDHLRYNMKRILPDGRQVFAKNPDPHFFDISLVNRPADPTAFALDKIAGEQGSDTAPLQKLSADLGEEAELYNLKTAALDKLSDMLKHIEGTVADTKGEYSTAKELRDKGFEHMEFPHIPHGTLKVMRVSPCGLASMLKHFGAPMSFGDALWMGGRHVMGPDFCEEDMPHIMRAMPKACSILKDFPDHIEHIIKSMLSDYDGEFDNPARRQVMISVMRPVAQMRITVFSKMASEAPRTFETSALSALHTSMAKKGTNFEPIKLSDGTKTAPFFVNRNTWNRPAKILGAALGACALTAVLKSPDLAEKLLYGTVMGLPAMALLSDKAKKVERTESGETIPVHIAKESWKTNPVTVKQACEMPLASDMAITLDYCYNSWKYLKK